MKVTSIVTCAVIITVMLAGAALCDPTIKVTFPEKGSYLCWIDAKGADGKPVVTAPIRLSGQDGDVDLEPVAANGKLGKGELRVYDPKSGNIAAKSLANLEGKKDLKLKTADFDRVGRVRIVLKPADGKPDERVESAVVTLRDANSDVYMTVVDPSSEGVAEFRNVAGGMESVTVAAGKGKTTVEMEAPLERKDSIFTYTIPVSGDVRTVKVSAPAAAKPGEKSGEQPKKTEVTVVGGWATSIVGIIALALIAFIVYTVVKSKGMTLEKALRQAGVQFPQDNAGDTIPASGTPTAPATPAVDPSMCPFCGQRKDANGRCACSVDSVPSVAAATGVPRLVGMQGPYMGRIFEIGAGEMTIGRDTGNTLPLDQDNTSSRRHAKIDGSGVSFTISDLGSSNGTFVNGAKIAGSQPLRAGDEVQIGSTKFKFEL